MCLDPRFTCYSLSYIPTRKAPSSGRNKCFDHARKLGKGEAAAGCREPRIRVFVLTFGLHCRDQFLKHDIFRSQQPWTFFLWFQVALRDITLAFRPSQASPQVFRMKKIEIRSTNFFSYSQGTGTFIRQRSRSRVQLVSFWSPRAVFATPCLDLLNHMFLRCLCAAAVVKTNHTEWMQHDHVHSRACIPVLLHRSISPTAYHPCLSNVCVFLRIFVFRCQRTWCVRGCLHTRRPIFPNTFHIVGSWGSIIRVYTHAGCCSVVLNKCSATEVCCEVLVRFVLC